MLSLSSLLSKASSINRKIEKDASKWEDDTTLEQYKDTLRKCQISKLKKDIYTMIDLKNAIHEIEEETGEQLLFIPQGHKQYYFITVRPDTSKVKFIDFYNDVQKFTSRKCFQEFKLSFEQKGTTDETLGQGFHVHIVAKMSQRSKGEVLRDTQSTFKNYTAPNCIEVLTTKNPQELVDNYLVNYVSDDEHKIVTKAWDAKWRSREILDSLYTGPLPIKSILAGGITIRTIKNTQEF